MAARPRAAPLLLLGGAALYLYLNLFAFPCIPVLLQGDQNNFWAYALRMLQGERVYRDFFQFTTPGTDLVFLALFKMFGTSIWVTDVAVIALGVSLCWVCFDLSARIMPRAWATVGTATFLVLVYGPLLDATHHWFGLLAMLSAARALMPRRTTGRLATAGALLGVASFFTQSTGVAGVAGLSIALAWEGLLAREQWADIVWRQLTLMMAFGTTLGVLCAYPIAQVGWHELWYDWVTYPTKFVRISVPLFRFRFAGFSAWQVIVALGIHLQRACIYALLLFAHPWVWWQCWRRRRDSSAATTTTLMLLSLPGFLLLLPAVTRPNWGRLYQVFLPTMILSFWLLAETRARRNMKAVFWAVLALSALSQTAARQRQSKMTLDLPAGRAVVADEDRFEQFSWLREHTTPGDWFFQTRWLNSYFPLKLKTPGFVDALTQTEMTRPEQVARTVQQLVQTSVQYILWTPEGPPDGSPHYRGDRLEPFHAYLLAHYRRVHVFSNQDEIWQLQVSAQP